ncbi:hypothetical protein [Oceanidesulfovibrio marinus]|uniref:Uncharacterized protein n=1 Tax=Oceanidesulfovibrio marinus TaxID=370038 RepID=A0ABX6NHF1_9BACT|nr:hypothetical protein [Oceanidesulfovibrio marinus]QJT10067.1 hypothetical protein E8L03_14520 [Oceanidesulfovibrio marinus]
MDLKSIVSRAGSSVSTTYLAVIVAGIMSIGRMAGVELVEQDVANVVMLAALAYILVGRAKAPGPMAWWTRLFGGGKIDAKSGQSGQSGRVAGGLVAVLATSAVLATMSAAGCAALQDRTDYALYEMADTYMDLHEDYVTAFDASDASGRAWMRSEVAPSMDRAKRLLDAALTTAIAGQEVREQDLSGVKAALTEAALAISDIIAGKEE